MKIAVASKGQDLAAPIDPRFGRCPYLVIIDTSDMTAKGLENPGALAGTGAGIAAAQLAADAGAEAVVAHVFGPKAFQALQAGSVKVYVGATGTVEDAVKAVLAGELDELNEANADAKAGASRRGRSCQ